MIETNIELTKIAYYLDDKSPLNGGARPLINWAKAMPNNSILITKSDLPGLGIENFEIIRPLKDAKEIVRNYNYLVVSDNNLRSGIKLTKKTGSKLVVYCQVPFGLHALGVQGQSDGFLEKIIFSVIKFIPFRLLSLKYRTRLKKADLILSNSLSLNALLNFVYGISESGVVYPPVDSIKFLPKKNVKKNSILVFVGRDGDLNELNALGIINDICIEFNTRAYIFGSARVPSYILKKLSEFKVFHNITDEQLIEAYNNSFVTISLQKQEYFGYVPIESLLCGTPAITFYNHDAAIIDSFSKKYLKHSNLSSLKHDIVHFMKSENIDDLLINRKYLAETYSANNFYFALLKKFPLDSVHIP